MPEKSDDSPKLNKEERNTLDTTRQSALALELPFTMVGALVVGGLIGYLLDRWLHTAPWLMVVFGAFGFFGGVREVVRRLRPQ